MTENLCAALSASQIALIICLCCAACCCALGAVCLAIAGRNAKRKDGEQASPAENASPTDKALPPENAEEPVREQPPEETEETLREESATEKQTPPVKAEPRKAESAVRTTEKAKAEPAKAEPVKKPAPPAVKPAKKPPVKAEKKPVKFVPESTETPAPEGKVFVRIRYNRSFTARLIQSPDALKKYYSDIKNELLKYGLKSRISWKAESFRHGRKLIAKAAVRGKTLNLYLAADPAKYDGTKYKVQDVSARATTAATPLRYKISNDRRSRYSAQLIADAAAANGLAAGEAAYSDYAAQYPYEELEPLIKRKLVRVLTFTEKAAGAEEAVIAVPAEALEEVSVAQAEELMPDERVEEYVEESVRFADRTKKAIVNIDTLAKYFKKGETVTVEEIKKRVPEVGKRTTYIKVLARGRLDKALTVEADDFTAAAVKMIILTGGKVIRTKTRV